MDQQTTTETNNGAAEQPSGGAEQTASNAGQSTGSVLGGVQQPGDWLPEKYRVSKEDGALDLEASSRKLADSYKHLEKRMGSGDAPPKSPDEYDIKIDSEYWNFEEFKKTPETQAFLKAAHAKGISNAQLEFVLGEYVKQMPELVKADRELTAQEAEAELRKTWATDADYKGNVQSALKAFNAFASDEDRQRINEIGNNPIVLRLLANIGREMGEDLPPSGLSASGVDWDAQVNAIKANPAYNDAAHPEHQQLVDKMSALFNQRYGKKFR